MKSGFVIILLFSTVIWCIEGIDPPRRPVRLDVELEQDIQALPGKFIEIFEEPYLYFLRYSPDTISILGRLSTGKFGISGNTALNFNYGNAYIFGLTDTVQGKSYRAASRGKFRHDIMHKIPLQIGFNVNYSKTKWFSRYYSAELNGSAYYPWRTGLSAVHIYSDGLLAKYLNFSSTPIDEYKDMGISMLGRGYQFISRRLGIFAEAGYHISRRGENFVPQRARNLAGGIFAEYAPWIFKLGVSYGYVEHNFQKKICPAIVIRYLGYPVIAEAHYGTGIRTNPISEYFFDERIEDYGFITPTIVETVGVKIKLDFENFTIEGSGIYGLSLIHI